MSAQHTPGPIKFRAIAMLADAYCGSQIRVREQGLRWLSRSGNFGSEIVIARDDAAECSVKFEISQHYERKGGIEAPTAAQVSIIERLQAAGVLKVDAAIAKADGDAVGGKSGGAQQEAMPGDEAAEIIGDLIAGIEKHGMYSKESTLMSLTQAYYSLRPENPPLASREQEIELTLARRIDEIAALFGSLREAASVLEIDAGYLSRLRSGEKSEPSDDILKKLGLKRKLSYVHTQRQYAASPLIPRTRSA